MSSSSRIRALLDLEQLLGVHSLDEQVALFEASVELPAQSLHAIQLCGSPSLDTRLVLQGADNLAHLAFEVVDLRQCQGGFLLDCQVV